MMRRSVVRSFLGPVFILSALGPAVVPANAQHPTVAVTGLNGQKRFTVEQLDNLTAPIALYPDALLAQVLVAATFPDQVEDAAAFVRANGTDGIDSQAWDVSIKAVAHYPSALNSMADKIDWTTALGKAYASQSSEVMSSVQRLRAMAANQGNLKSTQQQQIVQDNGQYEIAPTQTSVIYVPVYDPYIVYTQPIFNVGFRSSYWSFGVGFPIGAWLNYDCDWGLRRVYYNGWDPVYYGYAGNWRERARPYVRITDIYISPRYRDVYVNHNVVARYVDYRNVDRYGSVHRGQHFDGRPDHRQSDGEDRRGSDSRNARRGADPRNEGVRGTQQGTRSDGDDRTARPRGTDANNNPELPGKDAAHNGNRNGAGTNGNRNGGGTVDGKANSNGGDRNGTVRIPPANRRSEPPHPLNGPEIVPPSRRDPPTRGAQEQQPPQPVTSLPTGGQVEPRQQNSDQRGGYEPRNRTGGENRRAQPVPQSQPVQLPGGRQPGSQQQPATQQQSNTQPQQRRTAQPREPTHEQQQSVQVQQSSPAAPPSSPAKARDEGRGDAGRVPDRGRGRGGN